MKGFRCIKVISRRPHVHVFQARTFMLFMINLSPGISSRLSGTDEAGLSLPYTFDGNCFTVQCFSEGAMASFPVIINPFAWLNGYVVLYSKHYAMPSASPFASKLHFDFLMRKRSSFNSGDPSGVVVTDGSGIPHTFNGRLR
jgi:hypothetical protein